MHRARQGRREKGLCGPALALALALFVSSSPSRADCVDLNQAVPAVAERIELVPSKRLPAKVLEKAVAAWGQCANYGSGFPSFVVGERGTRSLEIDYQPHVLGHGRCGSFRGRTIRLHQIVMLSGGKLRSCGSLAQNLAHELGHALGLGNARRVRACRNSAMAAIDAGNAYTRRVTAEECQAVGQRWLTAEELSTVAERTHGKVDGFVIAGAR